MSQKTKDLLFDLAVAAMGLYIVIMIGLFGGR